MLLDRTGDHATVYLGPDREPAVIRDRATTNHQETVVWPELAASSNTVRRLAAARSALDESGMTLDALAARFLERPLHSRSAGSPTVYTAVYRPAEGKVDYIWPGKVVRQDFDQFEPSEYVPDYGTLVSRRRELRDAGRRRKGANCFSRPAVEDHGA